jgi:5-formyltetrahydrofolate cyclo-ligase
VLESRRALPRPEAARLSARICERFASALAGLIKRPLELGLYRALPDELDLVALEASLAAAGHSLHFPRVLDRKNGEMEFADLPMGTAGWEKGPYGIEQPLAQLRPVPPESLDLIVVPGVAFGEKGERVGMGAGYFDRYLPRAPRALRVALAFDLQLVAHVEQDAWDLPVDWLLTESRELRYPRFVDWCKSLS